MYDIKTQISGTRKAIYKCTTIQMGRLICRRLLCDRDHPTFVLRSLGVAVHCRHPLLAVAPSLNPPRRLVVRLSADIIVIVPKNFCPQDRKV